MAPEGSGTGRGPEALCGPRVPHLGTALGSALKSARPEGQRLLQGPLSLWSCSEAPGPSLLLSLHWPWVEVMGRTEVPGGGGGC